MSAVLDAKNLSFTLSKKKILDGISLSIHSGEVVAVVGHNGAGKTTLFHLIFGLKFQNSGELTINGIPATKRSARQKLSFVPERPYLNPNDTAFEMLKFYGKLAGVYDLENRIEQVIQEVGLEQVGGKGVAHRKLKTFSKGMLQRSLIAQALLNDPEFLILDEPMSGLDPEGREWVKSLILKLKSRGRTILFSTHTIEDVGQLAGKVLVLSQGTIKYFGDPKHA